MKGECKVRVYCCRRAIKEQSSNTVHYKTKQSLSTHRVYRGSPRGVPTMACGPCAPGGTHVRARGPRRTRSPSTTSAAGRAGSPRRAARGASGRACAPTRARGGQSPCPSRGWRRGRRQWKRGRGGGDGPRRPFPLRASTRTASLAPRSSWSRSLYPSAWEQRNSDAMLMHWGKRYSIRLKENNAETWERNMSTTRKMMKRASGRRF